MIRTGYVITYLQRCSVLRLQPAPIFQLLLLSVFRRPRSFVFVSQSLPTTLNIRPSTSSSSSSSTHNPSIQPIHAVRAMASSDRMDTWQPEEEENADVSLRNNNKKSFSFFHVSHITLTTSSLFPSTILSFLLPLTVRHARLLNNHSLRAHP